MTTITESDVEYIALEWLETLGWRSVYGPDIAPGEPESERTDYTQVVLEQRLLNALADLNPELSAGAIEDAFLKVTLPQGSTLEARNQNFHSMLVDGVQVEYQAADGSIRGENVAVIDFDEPQRNDLLAVNQFTVMENRIERRPDVVLFVNGLPLGIIELKNPVGEDATVDSAFDQLQTYKADLPTLFSFNELLIASDGLDARMGTITAGKEWFKPWRTISGEQIEDVGEPELHVMLSGACAPERFLSLTRNFIVFEDDGGALTKKVAGYHQFHAVHVAVAETLRAAEFQQADWRIGEATGRYETGLRAGGEPGDRRIGVIWHTQGSGKSLTMVFYVGMIAREPAMKNPTIVVLTDRNDLDDQLFGTFWRCQDLLRQEPVQATTRADLRQKLSVEAGGVVFTTIQKFFPEEGGDTHPLLTDRNNIVVIADEAHRSQYGFRVRIDEETGGMSAGFAKYIRDALPNASFVGFTGTPIELRDANTLAVFGECISIYDIQRSVEDGATVPIFYESRLSKLSLDQDERPSIDAEFEEATEGEEVERREKLKTKWAQMEALVGSEERLRLVAKDIIDHFEKRIEALDGKAMVVCMSRRICVELYKELVRLRPGWEHNDDDKGEIKVVMTGAASDRLDWQRHIRNKQRREDLANRFRDAKDPLRVVLVRDMWLTGFDAPSLHTMYLDKPMRGHSLMQAISRVNRVFGDKPGGRVVDYLGVANELRQAVIEYTESEGEGRPALDQEEAVSAMLEKYEVCFGLFHGFDWSNWLISTQERLRLLPAAQEHVLAQENGKDRFVTAVRDLSSAFALAVPDEEALKIRDDIAFFQAVRSRLLKRAPGESRSDEELDNAIRQIVSRAVASEEVVDVFAAAGLKKPDISVLSEEFLAEVRAMPHRNLAVELLQKLIKGEISTRRRKSVVQARSFADLLEQTLRRYESRSIEAAQVIEELIQMARDIREASERGEKLGLTDEELAFYDALETNDSAVQVLGDDTLRDIARELVRTVRNNVTIDWTLRESARANLRRLVRRLLRRHGYPPDKQEKATQTVLEQAEVMSGEWVTVA